MQQPFFTRDKKPSAEPTAPVHTGTSVLSRSHSSAPSPRHLPDPEKKLTALGESLLAIDQEHERKRAELEAEIARAKELQHQLALLNRRVDDAGEVLARADSQFQQCKAAAAQVRTSMLAAWGTGHADGTSDRPPSYQVVVDLDASIADFPRVREHLAKKVKDAEAVLSTFQRENEL